MIEFLQHSEIDKAKWNRCVARSLSPSVFADFGMLSLASPDWCALVSGDYQAVMPLIARRKWGISYLCTPIFFSCGGIFTDTPVDDKLLRAFLERIPRRFLRADLLLNENCPDIAQRTLRSYRLALAQPFEVLAHNFSENCRRNIKSAEKQNLTFSLSGEISEIINLFRRNRGASLSLRDGDYALLESCARYAQEQDWLEICSVSNSEGKLLAGAFMLRDYDKIRFWFSGRNSEQAASKSMFFLISNYLKMRSGASLIFDFNGSMNENIARFYRGFGAEVVEIPYIQIYKLPLENIIRQIFKNK